MTPPRQATHTSTRKDTSNQLIAFPPPLDFGFAGGTDDTLPGARRAGNSFFDNLSFHFPSFFLPPSFSICFVHLLHPTYVYISDAALLQLVCKLLPIVILKISIKRFKPKYNTYTQRAN